MVTAPSRSRLGKVKLFALVAEFWRVAVVVAKELNEFRGGRSVSEELLAQAAGVALLSGTEAAVAAAIVGGADRSAP